MKILIISNHAFPAQGPRAYRTTELSEQLAKMGHEVTLYTVHGKYDYTNYENQTKIIRRDIRPKFATYANDGTHRYNIFDKFMFHYFHRLLMWPLCEFHRAVSNSVLPLQEHWLLILRLCCLTNLHPHLILNLQTKF